MAPDFKGHSTKTGLESELYICRLYAEARNEKSDRDVGVDFVGGLCGPRAGADNRQVLLRGLCLLWAKDFDAGHERWRCRWRYGLEAYNARNWTQAIEDLKEALQICGNCRFSAELHRNLGLVCCHKGDIEVGKRELETALKLKPDDDDARRALEILGSIRAKPDNAR